LPRFDGLVRPNIKSTLLPHGIFIPLILLFSFVTAGGLSFSNSIMQLIHTILLSTTAALVAGHSALVEVGDKNALGVQKTTGLTPADAIRVSTADPCGTNVNLASLSATNATDLSSDTLNMSVFVITPDGAGPFKVAIDTGATGKQLTTQADITTNVPGTNGVSSDVGKAFPLDVTIPPGTVCSGGQTKNLCLVQVKNPSGFGGCGLFELGGTAGTSTTSGKAVQVKKEAAKTNGTKCH
jgi:Egh16-like virulence factor